MQAHNTMKLSALFICLYLSAPLFAKSKQELVFKIVPTFSGKPVDFDNTYYHLTDGDSIMLETFKCYISNVVFYKAGGVIFAESNSFHLLDASAASAMQFTIAAGSQLNYDEVGFDLGIDSTTNVSGALGGDLDPTKGMYWSWQSGYINLKLEGRSNRCKTRNNEFQFHLGGYSKQTKALAPVRIKIAAGPVVLGVALDKFFQGIDLATNNSIMIPGAAATALAHKLALCMAPYTE